MPDPRLEPLVLADDERRILENWARRRRTAQGLAVRARIVLACAQGDSNLAVSARLGVNRGTVTRWRARFLARRLDGLGDEPRPGVPRTITDAQVEEVVVRTLEEVPEGATHWSRRELAKRVGISPASVHRIWRAFGLQPWRTEDFKIPASSCTSPPRTLPGSARSSGGSPNCNDAAWTAACSAHSTNSPPRWRTGSRPGTAMPGPSTGPRPPTRSSTASAATAHASPERDTS